MYDLMSDDAADLSAARSGGPNGQAAFARIYDRHAPVVLALCRQNLPGRDPAGADDALQEVFIRAWRKLDTFTPEGDEAPNLRPWLYAIARFVCSERRRAAGRRNRHEEAAAMNHVQERSARVEPAREGEVSQRVDRDEQLARLDEAMEQLPERERLAIHLYYLDSDPVEAAQSALGLSRSGFYKLLNRAKEQLAGLMSEASPS
jgi:RNA polymerase sigma-70 factor (ECF subfamily)